MTVKGGRHKTFREEARSEWTALGPVGRTVLIALAMSALVAVALALVIPQRVEGHLIESDIRTLTRIAGDFADAGMIPLDPGEPAAMSTLDVAVRGSLLGSDTVRVKVWLPDGSIAYSDVRALTGQAFPLSVDRIQAFSGEPTVETPDLTKPENAYERDLPPLREFYIPVAGDGGEVVAVFEVYRLYEPIETTVGDIRGYVWLSVGIAIGLLGIFVAVLILTNGRAITRRQRLTERLFGDLVRAQAEERSRIIGSLHDDIGQSLYRIHYGLEDVKSRIDTTDGQTAEALDHLGTLVGEVDKVLRAELHLLDYGTGEELALGPALDELAEVTEMESDLAVSVQVDDDFDLSPTSRVALFRAAREAITNVRKHARATTIDIRVDSRGGNVRLRVIDDGVGIAGDEGLGLTTTRQHLEAIGGGLRVNAAHNGGTTVVAWVPTDRHEAAT